MPKYKVTEILATSRLDHVRYAIRDLAMLADELTLQGKDVLMFNVGDPLDSDFRTPPQLIETVVKAMREGKNGYAPALGVDEALKAIRREAQRKGIHNVQDVFITQGVTEGVDFCLTALLNPGDELLVPSPGYPLYSAVVSKLDGVLVPYDLQEELGWEPDIDALNEKISPRTRGIVLINPNNPTGVVHSREVLEGIAECARRNGLVIFADEIYDKLVFDGAQHISIAALAPDVPVVTFGGLSKGYLAPGWRVGWGVVSGNPASVKTYTEGIHKLLRTRLCANHAVQYAIRPALEGSQDHLGEVICKLQVRRDATITWCNSTPHLSCVQPMGGFYAFPKLDIVEEDVDFVKALLVKKQVLVVHGGGFGQSPGTRHFRFVFLPEETKLKLAYEAIAEFIHERRA